MINKRYLYSNFKDNFKFILGIFLKKVLTGPHTVMIDIEDNCKLCCEICFYHSFLINKKNIKF